MIHWGYKQELPRKVQELRLERELESGHPGELSAILAQYQNRVQYLHKPGEESAILAQH
jgi:hypothetical protein